MRSRENPSPKEVEGFELALRYPRADLSSAAFIQRQSGVCDEPGHFRTASIHGYFEVDRGVAANALHFCDVHQPKARD
jgi:hypothetical protein